MSWYSKGVAVSGQLLDGKALAKTIKTELAADVVEFIENNSIVPRLAAVLVGEDPASDVYVRNKRRSCEQVGIESELHRLPADTTQEDLLNLVAKLNKSNDVHGILVQLPLPRSTTNGNPDSLARSASSDSGTSFVNPSIR